MYRILLSLRRRVFAEQRQNPVKEVAHGFAQLVAVGFKSIIIVLDKIKQLRYTTVSDICRGVWDDALAESSGIGRYRFNFCQIEYMPIADILCNVQFCNGFCAVNQNRAKGTLCILTSSSTYDILPMEPPLCCVPGNWKPKTRSN